MCFYAEMDFKRWIRLKIQIGKLNSWKISQGKWRNASGTSSWTLVLNLSLQIWCICFSMHALKYTYTCRPLCLHSFWFKYPLLGWTGGLGMLLSDLCLSWEFPLDDLILFLFNNFSSTFFPQLDQRVWSHSQRWGVE